VAELSAERRETVFRARRETPPAWPTGQRNDGGRPIADRVAWDSPGAREIAFEIPQFYNASDVLFENLAKGHGDHLAVTGPAGQRSYAQLCAEAARWGHALLSLGLTRGERVLLLLDDTPVYPAAFFGAVRAGLVPLLISPLTPPDLLQFYLADSEAKAAVAEASLCDRFDHRVCVGQQLKTLIIVNGRADVDVSVDVKDATTWLRTFAAQLPAANTHRNEMAFWMYSSGSTGRPKGIVHLQHDMPYTQRSYGRHVLKLTPDDLCFSVSKIFFSYGFGNSISFPFAVGAASLLLRGRPKPAAIFDAIARYRPTVFFGVPTLYTALMKATEADGADLSSIRLAVSAAEVLSPEVASAWQRLTGVEIIECLGSTELLNVYLSNTPERKKPGSTGLRVPGYELVLKAADEREIAGEGEGILWVRGHSATPLYWNSPEQTARTVRDDGWIRTGDCFARDADGFYTFRGRVDDLVKISGQWVYPVEVQLCLAGHPAVRECAVLAVELPDRRLTLKAFVVMNDKSFDPDHMAGVLQDYVKRTLLPYKYPRIVHFMRELPKTATGKLDREALRHADLAVLNSSEIRSKTADPRLASRISGSRRSKSPEEQDHESSTPKTAALGRS
jgi:benzoate-CoA ligase family protein